MYFLCVYFYNALQIKIILQKAKQVVPVAAQHKEVEVRLFLSIFYNLTNKIWSEKDICYL